MYISTPEDLNVDFGRMTYSQDVLLTENFEVRGIQNTVRHENPAVRVFEFEDHFLYITESDDQRYYQCRDCWFTGSVPADAPDPVLAEAEQYVYGWAATRPCGRVTDHRKL